MKKKPIYLCILFVIIASFVFYIYGFMRSDAENLSLMVYEDYDAAWEITTIENDKEIPISPSEAINFEGTAILKRTIPEEWANYSRVEVNTGRAICVFVDNKQEFCNHNATMSKPGELELMKLPEQQPFFTTFTFNPDWIGKELTMLTRLYENEPFSSIDFMLINENVFLVQHEAWVITKAIPGGMFGLLSMLLFGLFMFQYTTQKKGYSTLLLSFASLMQMFISMGSLNENPFPLFDQNLATAVYFLLPLLYIGTKFSTMKKPYFISILTIWSIYFILYIAIFVLYLPLPYWMDKIDLVCFALIAIMLYCCSKEYKLNVFAKQLLHLLAIFALGFVLLFVLTSFMNPHLHEYIVIIAWREVSALYCRPLLFWIFTTFLFACFILALSDVLQSRIRSVKEVNEMKLHTSLISQSLLHAETTNEALAIMRHDEMSHLRTLSQYMSEDVDKAREYADSLTQNLAQIPTMRFTKNKLVNSILSAQFIKANEQNVEFTTRVEIEENLPLSSQDLTTVLMNLLDNALHAASKADRNKTKPSISINLKQDEDMLYIKISNSLPVDFDKQKLYDIAFTSSRSANELHGWGIRSVKTILSSHGAELGYQVDDEITVHTVMQFQNKTL